MNGSYNLVVGSNNQLIGDNDWLFTSDYNSKDSQNGILIIGNYKVILNQVFSIKYNPSQAISCLNKADKDNFCRSNISKRHGFYRHHH